MKHDQIIQLRVAHAQLMNAGYLSLDYSRVLVDPLEKAIRDPQVDIYDVVALAEARA